MTDTFYIDNDVTDNELVECIKNQDERAFELLVNRYAPRLYQAAYAILNSHCDAEEVVQEALMKAYRALPQFRGESTLLTWLYRIVVNQAHNKYHWNKRRGSEVNFSMSCLHEDDGEENQEDLEIADERYNPERTFANQELGLIVKREMEQLPDALKETMILRYLSDLPYEEIARIQSCQIGTIKSRLSRGREILMKRLERYGIGVPAHQELTA